MTVFPKHVTLPNNNNEANDIAGLESIHNAFDVTVSLIQDISKI